METVVLQYILDNHGAVVTSDLFNLCDTSTLTDLVCKNETFVACLINGTPSVVVRSSVRLCWRKGCAGCGSLHLCKGFFLTGSCQFSLTRRGCIFSHDIHSDYNDKILREFGLETLSRTQLCVLLLQSNSNLLPSICHNYNNRSGCEDGSCQRLHICEKFLCQDCSCFRAHDFTDPQPSKLLQDKRIPDSLFKSLKSVYTNKAALWLADKPRRNRGDKSSGGPSVQRAASSPDLLDDSDDDSSQGTPAAVYSGRGRGGRFRGGLPSQGPMDPSDTLDDGLDSSTSVPTNRGGHGKGRNPGRRGRGGRGGRGGMRNTPQTDGMPSPNDLQAESKNPKNSADKRPSQAQRDKTEICMYFIKGHCKHEDRCFKAHDKMPYRWEVKQDGQWTHMAQNEKIEQAYCDPANTYSTTSPLVYFDTMTCEEKEVRRLSTINSVREPSFIHTTEWLWFWEDNHGQWHQYGAPASAHELASVTSKQLEEMYLKDNTGVIQFKAGFQSYQLSFPDMIQTNIQYGTKRIVRRRPRFVSAVEVQTKKKLPTNNTPFPDYWDKTQISPTEYRCVSLQSSLGEYKEIHDLFCQTMKGFDILKIERIQNQAVWEAFQLQKNQLKNKNNGQPVTEKKLFHGTDPSLVKTICATNFDWRVCGVNGTAYGQGSYFARDAKYSHSYTGTSDVRFMFVSRVLVGDYTRGRSEYRKPPSKDGGDVNLYDSCVDDVTNPSIFVVFEKQQIYPEYVLQYKEKGRQTLFPQPATYTAATNPPKPASTSNFTYSIATNPTTSSSPKTVVSNLATASSSVSSNVSVTNPTKAFTASSSNAFMSNTATKSATVSSNSSAANSTLTFPTGSSNAYTSNPAPTSTRLSNASVRYPTQTSPLSSPNHFQANLTSASSVRSSSAYATNSHTFTPDSSFRFAAATRTLQTIPTPGALQTTLYPTRATTPPKRKNNCVIA